MTIARHNLVGTNRFGHDAAEYPYCIVNLPAWKECPFDLHAAQWFRSREEAIGHVAGRIESVDKPPDSKVWSATFDGGVEVGLSLDHSRWIMRVAQHGGIARRKDFASPHLDHSKRTAEDWYGPPIAGWSPSEMLVAHRSRAALM
jgi:hypothetical protein